MNSYVVLKANPACKLAKDSPCDTILSRVDVEPAPKSSSQTNQERVKDPEREEAMAVVGAAAGRSKVNEKANEKAVVIENAIYVTKAMLLVGLAIAACLLALLMAHKVTLAWPHVCMRMRTPSLNSMDPH